MSEGDWKGLPGLLIEYGAMAFALLLVNLLARGDARAHVRRGAVVLVAVFVVYVCGVWYLYHDLMNSEGDTRAAGIGLWVLVFIYAPVLFVVLGANLLTRGRLQLFVRIGTVVFAVLVIAYVGWAAHVYMRYQHNHSTQPATSPQSHLGWRRTRPWQNQNA